MEVSSVVKHAADKAGLIRAKFVDTNLPTSTSNITALVCFGDVRSTFVLSSLLLKRIRENLKPSRYFILCSWPGYENLFPYVDEYWTLKDENVVKTLYNNAVGFRSNHNSNTTIVRRLNGFFEEVLDYEYLEQFYNFGISQTYFDKFSNIKFYLPAIPTGGVLGPTFMQDLSRQQGYKVFVYPTLYIERYRNGHVEKIPTSKAFWVRLAEHLLQRGYAPFVYKNYLTHDISVELTNKCVYITEPDMLKVLGAMRSVGCVLDIFNGISKLALAARCPYLACDERVRNFRMKEYEIEDLCDLGTPKQYIYTFPTIIENEQPGFWEANLFDLITSRLNQFMPKLNRDNWPTSSEIEEVVPYSKVTSNKFKKIGTKFIKIEKC